MLFEFGMLRPTAGIDDCVSSFIMNHLRESFASPKLNRAQRGAVLDTASGEDAFFHYKQIASLLDVLDKAAQAENIMGKTELRRDCLEEERVNLVTHLFLRMVDKKNISKLLDRLNPEERRQAEEKLGIVAFTFDQNNPTGFHKLNLSNRFEREVMMRLIELRNSQSKDVSQWRKHLNRATSGREEFEIVFRNLKHNGIPFVYSSSWRVPDRGAMEMDFVDIRKPPPGAEAMDKVSFSRLMASLKAPYKKTTQMVTEIRTKVNQEYLTCLQLWKLLVLFDKGKVDESRCRVEIAVACFARVIDWRAMRKVYIMEFLPSELASVEFRLGKTAIYFDEVASAVGYWELDLSNSEDRWITQELVYLASEEPGYNVIQAKIDATAAPGSLSEDQYRFDGIDFQIPITWVANVPSSGVVKLFYARQAAINQNYLQHGSWDRRGTPLLKPDKRCFPPDFRVPAIPNSYDEKRDGIEKIWVYIEKMRVIKDALLKLTPTASKM